MIAIEPIIKTIEMMVLNAFITVSHLINEDMESVNRTETFSFTIQLTADEVIVKRVATTPNSLPEYYQG